MEPYDLVLLFLQKINKLFFVLGVAHGDTSIMKVGPKNGNFQRFQIFFFRATEFQLQLLILIESFNIFYYKPAKKAKWVWSCGKIWAKLGPML